jgi:hypothetical protein
MDNRENREIDRLYWRKAQLTTAIEALERLERADGDRQREIRCVPRKQPGIAVEMTAR